MATYKEMSPKDKVLYCIQTLLKQGIKYPGSLSTRRTRDISSNAAYYTKLAVQALPELSETDIEELSRKKGVVESMGMNEVSVRTPYVT